MAKLSNYKGSIDLISGLRAKNDGDFPLMEAHDIVVDSEGTRLDEKLASIGTGGGSSGGSSTAIIEVSELPTENINTEVFYKVFTATFCQEARKVDPSVMRCIVVDSLPSEGEQAYNPSGTPYVVAYYNKADGGVYGYVTSALSAVMSVPVGWYPAATLFSALGQSYGGIITSLEDAVYSSTNYVLIEENTYSYDSVTAKWRKVVQATDEEKGLTLKHKKIVSFDDMLLFCTRVIPFRVFCQNGTISYTEQNQTTSESCSEKFIETILASREAGGNRIQLVIRMHNFNMMYLDYYVRADNTIVRQPSYIREGHNIYYLEEVDTSDFTDMDLYYFA